MNNPLLEASNCPFGTIPFQDIKFEHFLPAISSGIKASESCIARNNRLPR